MALTSAQIDEIRLLSGDDCTPPLVSDTQLNTWYGDNASICYVVVKVLQARMANATKTTFPSVNGATTSNPAVAQIQSLLTYWRSQCTEALPLVSIGEISLGIDEEDDEITYP